MDEGLAVANLQFIAIFKQKRKARLTVQRFTTNTAPVNVTVVTIQYSEYRPGPINL